MGKGSIGGVMGSKGVPKGCWFGLMGRGMKGTGKMGCLKGKELMFTFGSGNVNGRVSWAARAE
jgi:hypothetical protein